MNFYWGGVISDKMIVNNSQTVSQMGYNFTSRVLGLYRLRNFYDSSTFVVIKIISKELTRFYRYNTIGITLANLVAVNVLERSQTRILFRNHAYAIT